MSLRNLFQMSCKPLKDFLHEFNVAVTEVSIPCEDIKRMVLIREIEPKSDFSDWLAGKLPTTLDHFHYKANQCLRKEDARLVLTGHNADPMVEGVQNKSNDDALNEDSNSRR